MKDKEFVIKQKLCDIYYDPGAGFQSQSDFTKKPKMMGLMLVVGL